MCKALLAITKTWCFAIAAMHLTFICIVLNTFAILQLPNYYYRQHKH